MKRTTEQQVVRQKLIDQTTRRIGTLKGLARQLRVEPTPWTEAGVVEVGILQALEDCQREGEALLATDTPPEWARLCFEACFEQVVRRTFRHFEEAELEQERQDLESSIIDVEHEGDDTSDWDADDEG